MALALRTFTCGYCGKEFQKRRKQAPYCNRNCSSKAVAIKIRKPDFEKVCHVEGCNRRTNRDGICITHVRRMDRAGTYDTPEGRRPDGMSVHDWFMSKVDKGDGTGCWVWTGAVNKGRFGYGMFHDRETRKKIWAHHFLVPPVPSIAEAGEKMEYDHLCRNVLCVRPEHLELVTSVENKRRAREATERQCQDCGAIIQGAGPRVLWCSGCLPNHPMAFRNARPERKLA